MWLFTETGFVSAVCSPEDKDIMKVRARDKKSLLELSELAGHVALITVAAAQ